ncbi:MAG: glycosyltransferase [Acidimicrobiales bacterium]
MNARRALFLSGSFGAGHDTLAEACAACLEPSGVQTRIVDCMPMLGGGFAGAGDWVFRRLLSAPPLFDALHFSQLRGDGPVGRWMDRTATKFMFPKLERTVHDYDPDLIVSVFATGASAAVGLKAKRPDLRLIVFITDCFAHRFWVHEGTDLFIVTSPLTAASVRRYWPQAPVQILDAPVRPPFHAAPAQSDARIALGIPTAARCVLLMSGAWGIGPLDDVTRSLAAEGYWVLVVCGNNARLATKVASVAAEHPTVVGFGFTERIPELMAASDVVVTSSGDTCREARFIGRPIVLLDVVPGHGRENVIHELELGDAAVCSPTAASVTGTVAAVLAARVASPVDTCRPSRADWDRGFVDALRSAGVDLGP